MHLGWRGPVRVLVSLSYRTPMNDALRQESAAAEPLQDMVDRNEIPDVEELAERLRVLADPTRIRLIEALEKNGRSTVSALTSILPVSQQSVSHQLAILRGAGMVSRRREGVWVQYELRDWSGPWVLHQLADGMQAN
jgi:DNA-binding transcriptional ArsR family regulator